MAERIECGRLRRRRRVRRAHRRACGCSRRGTSVVVLEARDRVGGRIWTEHLADGTPIDRGGAWLAPYHDAIAGSPREIGVATYKTYVKGAHLLVDGDRIRRYTGLIPKISPLAVAHDRAGTRPRIDRMAKQVPLEAPWTASRAAEWDARSVADWLERSGIRAQHRPRPVRDGGARPVHRRPRRRLVPRTCCSSCARTAASTRCSRSRSGSQENLVDGGAGLDRARRSPTISATRCG